LIGFPLDLYIINPNLCHQLNHETLPSQVFFPLLSVFSCFSANNNDKLDKLDPPLPLWARRKLRALSMTCARGPGDDVRGAATAAAAVSSSFRRCPPSPTPSAPLSISPDICLTTVAAVLYSPHSVVVYKEQKKLLVDAYAS